MTSSPDPDGGSAPASAPAPDAVAPGEDEGGEPACYAHLVCPECGAVTTEGHRPGCSLAAD
jgi:hypothetical protein